MEFDSSIYVAGHTGLVGSAIVRKLKSLGYENIIVTQRHQVDLTNQSSVKRFMSIAKPDYVFLAAAKVGGIGYNSSNPAGFIYDNLMIQSNVIDAAYRNNVKKLMFLGSSCIYPKNCPQPMQEGHLLTGELEKTNEAYSISKISGIKMCEYYYNQYGFNAISVMPTNIYGINDNFNINTSHVIPSMIVKFLNEKTVSLMGDGSPTRDFLYVDDLADALMFLMKNWNSPEIINIGSGSEVSIKELADKISKITYFDGQVEWDTTKPNGTMRKLLDNTRINSLGWYPSISLEEGLQKTIDWYKRTGGIREI